MIRRASRALRALIVPAAAIVVASSCSELPLPHGLVWRFEPGLPTNRASLTGIVAYSSDHAVAVGYDRPEGLVANIPLAFTLAGGAWSVQQLPASAEPGSVLLNSVALGADGIVWACGRVADYEPEPSRITPVVYRCVGGVWSEFPIDGVGDLNGVELHSIATIGTGASLVVRVVGSAGMRTSGAALRYSGGRWDIDSLPPAPGTPSSGALAAVACGNNGVWYAAGARADGSAGVVYRDDGSGAWSVVTGLGDLSFLSFSSLAFDPRGVLWLGANSPAGDSLQGSLHRRRAGVLDRVPIVRRTGGSYTVHAIAFDGEGHGWVAGGRAGNNPFLAGLAGSQWTEWLPVVENDLVIRAPRRPGARPSRAAEIDIPGGGQLYDVAVLGAESAFSVGYKQGLDPKGFFESELAIYRLVALPPGEIDLVTRPVSTRGASVAAARPRLRRAQAKSVERTSP